MRRGRALRWVVLATVSACGGKAVIDAEPSGSGGSPATSSPSSSSVGGAVSTGVSSGGDDCPGTPMCPAAPPINESPCACDEGLFCEYDECAAVGSINGYQCDGGIWRFITAGMCEQPLCPNGVFCRIGEVCLIEDSGFQITYSCAADVCSPLAPSCDCAAELCGDDFACVSADATSVTCECTSC